MHRLFAVTAIIISTVLISVSADARSNSEAGKTDFTKSVFTGGPQQSSPKADRKKCFTNQFDTGLAQRCARELRQSRIASVQWAPGVQSSNLKIKRIAQRRGRGSGSTLGDIVCVKTWDKSSAFLKRAYKSRQRIPMIVLKGRDSRGQPMMLKLYSVKVTSYSINGSGLDDGSIPTETLSLNYEKAQAFP